MVGGSSGNLWRCARRCRTTARARRSHTRARRRCVRHMTPRAARVPPPLARRERLRTLRLRRASDTSLGMPVTNPSHTRRQTEQGMGGSEMTGERAHAPAPMDQGAGGGYVARPQRTAPATERGRSVATLGEAWSGPLSARAGRRRCRNRRADRARGRRARAHRRSSSSS